MPKRLQEQDPDDNKVPSKTALIPSEQRQVLVVEGEEVLAVRLGADIYVPLNPLCAALGIASNRQIARIRRDEVMAEGMRPVRIDTSGGPQVMQCLHLESVPLWLAGLEPSRVNEEIRPRLRVYKRWVRQKVWEAFAAELGLQQATPAAPATGDPTTISLEQVAELGRALTVMAEQQLAFQRQQTQTMIEVRGSLAVHESRLDTHEERLAAHDQRLNRAADVVRDVSRDIKALKSRLDPGNVITDEQAAELQETIKAIAEELTRQGAATGQQKNYYASLFSELHRRFRVSSYKNLTLEKYERAMAWLHDYDEALGHASNDPLDGLQG